MPSLAYTATEPQGHASLVGVDPALAERFECEVGMGLGLELHAAEDDLFVHMESGGVTIDAVVLGMAPEEAVRVAQRVHTFDKLIPILILAPPNASEQLNRTLMFSPFLGNEVAVWSTADLDILPAALQEAVKRRRQRLHYRNTLSNAQIGLEKLPLQQPEATHYLDRLLDYAPVGVVTVDLAGTIITLNRRAQRMLAARGSRLLGQALGTFFPRSERERLAELQDASLEDDQRQVSDVFEFHASEDDRIYLEVTPAPLAYRTGQRGFMLILQDVTSRIEAEQERRGAEAVLRHHVTVLRRFHEITSSEFLSLDAKLDEVLALGCDQFDLPTGILSRVEDDHLDVLRSVGGGDEYHVGSRHSLDRTFCGVAVQSPEPLALAHASREVSEGRIAWREPGLECYIGTRVNMEEGVYGTVCFFGASPRDKPFNSADSELLKLISRWAASEFQREKSNSIMRRLSGALEQIADGVIITDRDRYIEYANPAFETLTGYKPEEVIGHKTSFLRSGAHDERFYEELWAVIGAGGVYRGTLVNRKKDGSIYHEQKTISPLKDENGEITHFISTGHDITDLVDAEEKDRAHQAELAHVARLSTLGEMTSGLAHELNQPLCAITTYAQGCLHILQGGECKPDRVRYGLTQVVKQADLASNIFRRLMDFARKGEIRREPIEMARIIREVVDFVSAEMRQKLVKLHLDVPEDLPEVPADAIQIEQVLINLVRNSIDALGNLEEARRQIHLKVFHGANGWITVVIRDHGPGCPEEMRDRLFDPFVTSRPEGLGIGLSISQGIIDAHGGRLWLEQSSAAGAEFRFTLPVHVDPLA